MPRRSRIDAPGALHHIVVRGIERRNIFRDDTDRNKFLKRLEAVVRETKISCLAWSLMPNHFHLLLKTGGIPVSTFMRRLLTGYAVTFNLRHRRHGHLFQNRYKSILCQEDTYLLELVRYIHLNPVRAGIVEDIGALEEYPFSGHSAIIGRVQRDWQDIKQVLGFFGERINASRKQYCAFIQEGIGQGKRPDLIGGGLIRSHGGWAAVQAMRKAKMFQKSDERILGDGDFVDRVLSVSQEQMERKYRLRAQGLNLERVMSLVSGLMGVEASRIFHGGKEREIVSARSLLCYWTVRELGMSMADLSRKLDLSLAGVSQSVKRGEKLVHEKGYKLSGANVQK